MIVPLWIHKVSKYFPEVWCNENFEADGSSKCPHLVYCYIFWSHSAKGATETFCESCLLINKTFIQDDFCLKNFVI